MDRKRVPRPFAGHPRPRARQITLSSSCQSLVVEEYELICQYLKEHNFQEALAALEKERLVFCAYACYYLYVKKAVWAWDRNLSTKFQISIHDCCGVER